jgi:transcriptional regulator with XRE-family HTH domain
MGDVQNSERMRQPGDTADAGPETIGERIYRLRKEKGLRQSALTGPGVTAAQISRIESGKRQPSIKAVRRIASKLEVSPEYLETGVDITRREELELKLADLELRIRLDPSDEAVEADLETLISLARREGLGDIAAKAHAVFGMALADRGHLSEALGHLVSAIEHPLLEPSAYPDVYTTLSTVYCELGRARDAVPLCRDALERIPVEAAALRTVLVTYLSHALSELGEFEQAENVLAETGEDLEHSDPYSRARIHWSLARIAAMRDDRRLALLHMREAIELLKGTEDTVRLARAHLLCASILLWGGKTNGVSRHLRVARALFPGHAEATDRGMLLGYEALVAARQHRPDEALSMTDEALKLLPDHTFAQASSLYARALALAAKADYQTADEHFTEVIELAEKGRLWREAALVSRDRADMLRWAGKPYQSRQALDRAKDFESRLAETLRQGSAVSRAPLLGD